MPVVIDLEEENDTSPPTPPPTIDLAERVPVDVSPPQFQPPIHPASIFANPQHSTQTSFSPIPPAYSFPFPAPHNPTSRLAPFSSGSTSELFKCIVKKPDIMQMELNGEMHTNAPDVMVQFLAELRVYSTLKGHRNFPTYLGSLEGVGMVLEYIEGRSLLDVLRDTKKSERGGLDKRTKIDIWDQMVDGLTYLHSFGLSHGDLSLLNVLVTRSGTLKILDFGRSTSINSEFVSPSDPPPEPDVAVFAPNHPSHSTQHIQTSYEYRPTISRSTTQSTNGHKHHSITLSLPSPSSSPPSSRPSTPRPGFKHPVSTVPTPKPKLEQIHPGTRPFAAPEILREECTDPILADAYSFGMVMLCVDMGGLVDIDQRRQRNGEIPSLDGCEVFGAFLDNFLQDVDGRKRLGREDYIERSA